MYNLLYLKKINVDMDCYYPYKDELKSQIELAFIEHQKLSIPNSYALLNKTHGVAAKFFVEKLFEEKKIDSRDFISSLQCIFLDFNIKYNLKIAFDAGPFFLNMKQFVLSYKPVFGSLKSFVSTLEERERKISEKVKSSSSQCNEWINLISDAIHVFEKEQKETIFCLEDKETSQLYHRLCVVLKCLSKSLGYTFSVELKMDIDCDPITKEISQIIGEQYLVKDIHKWVKQNEGSDWSQFLPWLANNYELMCKKNSMKTSETDLFLTYLYYYEFCNLSVRSGNTNTYPQFEK